MRTVSQPLRVKGLLIWLSFSVATSFGQVEVSSSDLVDQQTPKAPGSPGDSSTTASPSGSAPQQLPGGGAPQPAQNSPISSPSRFHDFVGTFLSDEKAIWTSPLHAKTTDLRWLLPLTGATAAFLATDTDISNALPNTEDQINISRDVSQIGSAYTLYGVS